jgi:hypothetical protein
MAFKSATIQVVSAEEEAAAELALGLFWARAPETKTHKTIPDAVQLNAFILQAFG